MQATGAGPEEAVKDGEYCADVHVHHALRHRSLTRPLFCTTAMAPGAWLLQQSGPEVPLCSAASVLGWHQQRCRRLSTPSDG